MYTIMDIIKNQMQGVFKDLWTHDIIHTRIARDGTFEAKRNSNNWRHYKDELRGLRYVNKWVRWVDWEAELDNLEKIDL